MINDNITSNIVNEVKTEVLYQLNNLDISDINNIVDLIKNTKHNIFFCGVGKSELMANYCCNLLKSIGIKALNLNVLNSIHGDIGVLKESDLVILFSKSGSTKELISVIPFLKNKKCFTLGICCNNNSQFKSLCDKKQYKGSDFAILYRTNQQSRAIEECLTHHNIPHHIVGTTAFYQRVEVKVAIAYLQCLSNLNEQ